MRYLIFGDVHGNLPALEKMLDEEKGNYEQLICHGDVVNYGPWSNECVQLLEREACICLTGNHEDYFIKGEYPGQNLVAKTFFHFCYPQFTCQPIIAGYKSFFDIADYRIIHSINNHYFFPDTDLDSFAIDRNYIIGHSHYQFFKQINNSKVYNTGSVGQNRKFINQISYLAFDDEVNSIVLKTLEYNVDLVIGQMIIQKYPPICIDYYQQKNRI